MHALVTRLEVALERVEAALARSMPPAEVSLAKVLAEVWGLGRAAAESWTVGDLRQLGLINAAQAKRIGYDLPRLLADDGYGMVGPFIVTRLEKTRDGVVYKLRRRE